MTKIDQLKILDNKIRANKAQYNLDREAAKISTLSNGELDKYEYLSSEDLGYKPDVVQKAKFEYSPLGKVFNKGLDKDDKKEGLLKRLKNIEDKNKDQLDEIEYQGQNQLDLKLEKQLQEIKNQNKKLIEKLEREEKSEKIVLLQDNLDDNLIAYDVNITTRGEDILKKVANDEKTINHKSLFFKSGIPTINNYDFLKRFGTLHDLFLN